MRVKLKDITNMDKYIYMTALGLNQPFTTTELLEVIKKQHPGWKIELIKTRCKKYKKQKMLKKIGCFHNTKYECLLTVDDLKNAEYIYSKMWDANELSAFICGL